MLLCATLLQGKDKPTFSPWKDSGDVVVVKNARHVDFTGRKWEQKVYRWHTGCVISLMSAHMQLPLQHARHAATIF